MKTLIITYELIIDQFDVDFPKSIFILYFKKEKFEHEMPEKELNFSELDRQNEEHDKKTRGTYRLLGHFDCEQLFGKRKIKI